MNDLIRGMFAEANPSLIIDLLEYSDDYNEYWLRKAFNTLFGYKLFDEWQHVDEEDVVFDDKHNVVKAKFNWVYPGEFTFDRDSSQRIIPFHIRDTEDERIGDWHYASFDDCLAVAVGLDRPVQIVNGWNCSVEIVGGDDE